MKREDVFPCTRCETFLPRISRYRPNSWAWENAVTDLRRHLNQDHGHVPDRLRDNYMERVTTEDGPQEEAGRSGRAGR